ncbi:MAG: type II toxin-antitoxin system MqsA family antitoxin [Lentisphaerae bacterium]|nr:type II toxin-antitoxin system MqsA family antitoxin [Lentisphaerota bacterium]
MKTCYFCKGIIIEQRLDYMAKKRGQYVLVRQLPVESCQQCGEVYLDTHASRLIDKALSEIAQAREHLEVPVISLG